MRLAVALAFALTLAACDGSGPAGLVGDAGKGAPILPTPTTKAEQAVADGLVAFRAPGAIRGAACANCHAPDGLDLAYFDFSDADLRRRGAEHLPPEDVEKIVALVHGQRQRYGITPRDPRTARPFQPGGAVLPGATVPERDLAFARSLDAFSAAPVLTRADALSARDAWLAVDLRETPIGIPFNRWSEDPHHGDATLADWLPDLPRMPLDAAALYTEHDRYLLAPTDEALLYLLDRVGALTAEPYAGAGGRLMSRKYASALVAQHLFRSEVAGGSAWAGRPTSAFYPLAMLRDSGPNPVWEVGSFARDHKHGDFALPPDVLGRTSGDLRAEMTAMRIPWFWAGWLFDQGLQRTHGSNSTKSAEYLMHHLDTDFRTDGFGGGGYRVHAAFAITKKLVHEQYDAEVGRRADRFSITFSNFSGYDRAWRWAPTDPERRQRYTALTENSFRMWLHLMQAEAGPVDAARLLRVVDQMEAFFEWAETVHLDANRRLVAQTRAALGGPA